MVVAENGLQAMEHLRNENNHFDLLLLDLAMPEMDGLEVLSIMAEDNRLQKLPVVVMSANDSQQLVSDCLRLGAKDFLVKPVKRAQALSLTSYMVKDEESKQEEEKGLARFE